MSGQPSERPDAAALAREIGWIREHHAGHVALLNAMPFEEKNDSTVQSVENLTRSLGIVLSALEAAQEGERANWEAGSTLAHMLFFPHAARRRGIDAALKHLGYEQGIGSASLGFPPRDDERANP